MKKKASEGGRHTYLQVKNLSSLPLVFSCLFLFLLQPTQSLAPLFLDLHPLDSSYHLPLELPTIKGQDGPLVQDYKLKQTDGFDQW